ncbi:MAG: methionyl-tRNA formyltransferase [Candidatus Omnitrophota bacterium]|nr:methionyl-tRNA formyltransferase [Candidatus Omnitrophota bacterium]
MKYIYFGSSTFSRIVLEELCRQGTIPSLVISQPDKPKGRGLKFKPMEVAAFAKEKQIPLAKPVSLNDKEIYKMIQDENPDFIIVADYGKILPESMLSLAKILPLAIHPSLLPRYRGPAPVNWALINGETQTGTTIFRMNDKLDSGEIILQEMLAIEENDDVLTLSRNLSFQGAKMLIRVFAMIAHESYALIPQDVKSVSFAPKLTKDDGEIKWNLQAFRIRNLVRGTVSWPSAYTYYKKKLLKILAADVILKVAINPPGTITKIDKEGILVSTGEDILKLRKLKPQDKKEMDAYSFALGHRVRVGDRFD